MTQSMAEEHLAIENLLREFAQENKFRQNAPSEYIIVPFAHPSKYMETSMLHL